MPPFHLVCQLFRTYYTNMHTLTHIWERGGGLFTVFFLAQFLADMHHLRALRSSSPQRLHYGQRQRPSWTRPHDTTQPTLVHITHWDWRRAETDEIALSCQCPFPVALQSSGSKAVRAELEVRSPLACDLGRDSQSSTKSSCLTLKHSVSNLRYMCAHRVAHCTLAPNTVGFPKAIFSCKGNRTREAK